MTTLQLGQALSSERTLVEQVTSGPGNNAAEV